jgi:hypothetical protein
MLVQVQVEKKKESGFSNISLVLVVRCEIEQAGLMGFETKRSRHGIGILRHGQVLRFSSLVVKEGHLFPAPQQGRDLDSKTSKQASVITCGSAR